jgi:hypothetical protein
MSLAYITGGTTGDTTFSINVNNGGGLKTFSSFQTLGTTRATVVANLVAAFNAQFNDGGTDEYEYAGITNNILCSDFNAGLDLQFTNSALSDDGNFFYLFATNGFSGEGVVQNMNGLVQTLIGTSTTTVVTNSDIKLII